MMTSNTRARSNSSARRKASRKYSLTDSTKHPHLHQIHETLHNFKEDAKESYANHRQEKECRRQERDDRRSKRPQDGKTNPME
ncbi:hypothetical protein BDA99DRAFT_505336 [Phascolomyces articulosus]|uniref:Uncharacterized protein n=1 Tax=Phascolomyces articulosus TaxID=60185 RepID=A0AAD5PG10_9FUNG|nr:hypothetical protein BDA99DRAFT_505335 [Phascolomyces articulosus]KAI9268266.1 hypothetical protein BDA99DRAFT_505336 [Phascolomyces articulosus]